MEAEDRPDATWTRRSVLVGGAALVLAACSGGSSDGATPTTVAAADLTTTEPPATTGATTETTAAVSSGALTSTDFEALGACQLLPEQTAGPFPLDQQFMRRDITEGRDGHPLRLGLRVVDADCAPVPGVDVEIWHADPSGDYSAFIDSGGGKDEGPGTTFLRGTQTADADGIVEFTTIYPGWYKGRAVHIHVRVHRSDALALTSQLYFDEAYTAKIDRTGVYAQFGLPDTSWATDAFAGDPAHDGTAVHVRDEGEGTLALANIGIKPA